MTESRASATLARIAAQANAIDDPRDRLAWQVGALQSEYRALCEEIWPDCPRGKSVRANLGDAQVTVYFDIVSRDGEDIALSEAVINGACVPVECFDLETRLAWTRAAERHIEREREAA